MFGRLLGDPDARKLRRYAPLIQGTNPCGEIMLRDMEFCNLSEVVIRADDDLDTLPIILPTMISQTL